MFDEMFKESFEALKGMEDARFAPKKQKPVYAEEAVHELITDRACAEVLIEKYREADYPEDVVLTTEGRVYYERCKAFVERFEREVAEAYDREYDRTYTGMEGVDC